MKTILYITNIEVPYKVKFFNELAKHCDLTVLYEREKSSNRNNEWSKSQNIYYKKEYLNGINVGNENSFSLKIFKYLFNKYDEVIISCYNSPIQMLAIIVMRMLHKPYIISIDGELFIDADKSKSKIKKFFLRGAKKYLAAGEQCANNLKKAISNSDVATYYFSSLSESELKINNSKCNTRKRGDEILVVGQYFDYKGMDIALEAAKKNPDLRYKFIGMGKRTDLFIKQKDAESVHNVEIIPFLQKEDLENEYCKCSMLVLPSRQECWGLVINEAASFGTPIVATNGSGAAIEFLSDKYSKFIAEAGNADDLYEKINLLLHNDNDLYSNDLVNKSRNYSIEHMVYEHCCALEL